MKIHIVRKGDTLWEIAQQYGVDFEELKQFNPQLSSPDMIMPGMKIKIPSATKAVKEESMKESKKSVVKETPKKLPIVQEDDHEKAKEVKIEMPEKFIPGTPPKPLAPKKEVPVKKEAPKAPMKPIKEAPIAKEVPKAPVKPMKEMIKMPVIQEELQVKLPQTSQPKKQKEEKVVHQAPVAPIYHHYYHHCCPPAYHPCFPVMGEMTGGFMPHQQMHHGHGHEQMMQPMYQMPMQHMPPQSQQMMPPQDCGCYGTVPQMQPYQNQMREQMAMPFPGANIAPFGQQPYAEPHTQTVSLEIPSFQQSNHSFEKPFPMPPSYPPISEFDVQNSELEHRKDKDESTNE